ncbi:MAG: flagellar biosynthetic protein FliQ [Rhodobacteraceae bacterium]|nr:flagellar biosynthetic protein FliQ [Paracoccaceae bacterium]
MSSGQIYDILREALWAAVMMSTPLLAAALVIGVIIGLLQALTSIQEMTLTFVPKLAAMGVVYWVSMSFMSETLVALYRDQIIPLISGS